MICTPVRAVGILGVIGLAVGGCAGTHLYRKADHDLALKAQASFADAKVAEMTVEERKRLDEMLQADLKASRRQVLATRDADLLAIVGETQDAWPKLSDAIDARIKKLVGTREAVLEIVSSYNDAEAAKEQLPRTARAYNAFRTRSDPEATCPLPDPSAAVAQPGTGQDLFQRYKDGCRRYLDALDRIAKAGADGSRWKTLNTQVKDAEASRSAYQAELKKVQDAYVNAKREYDEAVKQGQAAQLSGLADRVRSALDTLGKPLASGDAVAAQKTLAGLGFGDLDLQGIVQALDERRRALTDLLGPASGTGAAAGATAGASDAASTASKQDAPAGTPLARAIAASIPSIEVFLSKRQAPPVTALVLESENLRLQSEGLKKRIAGTETQIALLVAERDAMRGEIVWLTKADRNVKELLKPESEQREKCKVTGDLANDLKSLSPGCRETGLRAVVFYANSWNLGRVMEDQIRYTRIAARHASALDASETALAQWQNLIAVPISQLVAYHGSGIKPEDIIALLQALGVAGIAAGVNR